MIDYLPKNEGELLNWLKNFSALLPSVGVTLGITPAEASSLNALIMDVKSDLRKDKSDNDEKKRKKENMIKFLNALVVKMKNHPSYSNTYGKELGLN